MKNIVHQAGCLAKQMLLSNAQELNYFKYSSLRHLKAQELSLTPRRYTAIFYPHSLINVHGNLSIIMKDFNECMDLILKQQTKTLQCYSEIKLSRSGYFKCGFLP